MRIALPLALSAFAFVIPGFALGGSVSPLDGPPAIAVAAPETLASPLSDDFPQTLVRAPRITPIRIEALADVSAIPQALRDTAAPDPERAALSRAVESSDLLGPREPFLARISGGPQVESLIAQLLANAPAALLRTLQAGRLDPIATGRAAQAAETGLNARVPDDLASQPPLPGTPEREAARDTQTESVDARAVLIGVAVLLALAVAMALVLRWPGAKPRLRSYRDRPKPGRVVGPNARPPGMRAPFVSQPAAIVGPAPEAGTPG